VFMLLCIFGIHRLLLGCVVSFELTHSHLHLLVVRMFLLGFCNQSTGAKVILTPAAQKGTGMVKKAAELAEKHGWFQTKQFENEANPAFHANSTGEYNWTRECYDMFTRQTIVCFCAS
jgi:TM2 domain-containing membrane protein YozV